MSADNVRILSYTRPAMKRYIRLGAIILTVVTVSFPVVPWIDTASACNLACLQRREQELKRQAAAAQSEAKRQALIKQRAEVRALEAGENINVVEDQLAETSQGLQGVIDSVAITTQTIANLESQLRLLRDQQAALLRRLQVLRGGMSNDLLLFSDRSFSDDEQLQAQFSVLKRSVANLTAKADAARVEAENQRLALVSQQNELQSLRDQQTAQYESLVAFRNQQAALANNAEATLDRLDAQAEAALRQAAQIEAQIQAEIARIIAQRENGTLQNGSRVSAGQRIGSMGSTGFSTGPHLHFEVRGHKTAVNPRTYNSNVSMRWPVNNVIVTQEFGRTAWSHWYTGGIHTGIDLGGSFGTPLYAAAAGTIVYRDTGNSGYGRYAVQFADNGLVLIYGHMAR